MAINASTTTYGTPSHTPNRRAASDKVNKVYGFDYPMGKYPAKGFFNKVSGKQMIYNNLRQLLNTERGERIMMPDYGVSLLRYLFEPLDDITIGGIRREILTTISRYEPRVEVVTLNANSIDEYGAEGLQAINITLTVKIKEEVNSQFDIQVKVN